MTYLGVCGWPVAHSRSPAMHNAALRAAGLDSIKAAANPARTGYLFFVRKPGKSGEHAFSKTNAQFERDVARYQASRGGP